VWEHIQKQAKIQPPETLLYQDLPLSLRVLRDMFSLDTHKILVDSTENHRRMTQFAEQYVQGALGKIELFKGERPLFETHNIEQEIARALQPRVNLNFGSYLIIESTEAMT
ncbi:ribonuclease E/G, partial [Neisseria sp. P0014.S004]